jgi:hypothetical protein
MSNVVISSTPVHLTATFEDALFIFDFPNTTYIGIYQNGKDCDISYDSRGFYWGYASASFIGIQLEKPDFSNVAYTCPTPFKLGDCYWNVGQLGITIILDIPSLTVVQVPIN